VLESYKQVKTALRLGRGHFLLPSESHAQITNVAMAKVVLADR
jgi:hypothetical protein